MVHADLDEFLVTYKPMTVREVGGQSLGVKLVKLEVGVALESLGVVMTPW